LGGRCAEEEFFGDITTGAYDDLKRAYELCFELVTKYGMSEKIGNVGFVDKEYRKIYSDFTNKVVFYYYVLCIFFL
jgi:AFG3 family protein